MYNQNIKVSVIIPVYNVEPYLKECLDSIINQTLKEIEIICIDDCSTDNSYKILEEYKKKDNRITIIKNEKNSGSGTSRNKGINTSKGEYIGFIDSDDYISADYFENLYNTAKKYNSDITITLNMYKDINKQIKKDYINIVSKENKSILEYESISNIKNINNISKENISYGPTNKIYNRHFIINNNLLFIENKIGSSEDADFIMRILLNNPKISYNNSSKYYYRLVNNSSMQSSKNNYLYIVASIDHMNNTINYCKTNNPEYLDYICIKAWHCPYYLFLNSNEINRKNSYEYLYNFANSIILNKSLCSNEEYLEYMEYLLIKNNDTYDKYLLQKELFEKIKLLDNKINRIIEKQNNKIKLFGIDKFYNKKIIYIFGIKITIKN